MKTAKKAIVLALCAVFLVVGTVSGTMAYLTYNAEITNVFTVGQVKVTLDEARVDQYGEYLSDASSRNAVGQSYTLVNGHTYIKDPTVHVDTGSQACYLFVEVVNGIENVEAASSLDYKTIAEQMESHNWVQVMDGGTPVTNIHVFTDGTGNLAKASSLDNPNVVIFEEFKIHETKDLKTLLGSNDNGQTDKTIKVKVYAVQAEGLDSLTEGKTPDKAAYAIWNAAFNTTP